MCDMPSIKILDKVLGIVELPSYVAEIINTAEFQRLRNIKKMSTVSFVISSANHTLYEHSIGSAYRCQMLLDSLEQNGVIVPTKQTRSKLTISPFHRKCVILAALLHDIGRGPFSSAWDIFLQSRKWNYKQQSAAVLKCMLQSNCIKLSDNPIDHKSGVEFIDALIMGTADRCLKPEDKYLNEIVASQINVRDWDGILRDGYYIGSKGISLKLPIDDIFKYACVARDENGASRIAHHFKNYNLISKYAENLFIIQRDIYMNAAVMKSEAALQALFNNAEENCFKFLGSGLKEIQCNLLKFNLLDDTIIEHMTLTGGERMASSTRSLKRRLGSYDMSFFEGASTNSDYSGIKMPQDLMMFNDFEQLYTVKSIPVIVKSIGPCDSICEPAFLSYSTALDQPQYRVPSNFAWSQRSIPTDTDDNEEKPFEDGEDANI